MKNHAWLNKEAYPFQKRYFKIQGQNLHYVDEGQGEPIVFVHGTPVWSFYFRHLIMDLRNDYRCIAPDHIGFGLSDKPNAYDYSTQNHSHTLEKLLLSLRLPPITLVVHDFGGPIGMAFALRHPHLVKRVVVMNTWLWNSEQDTAFQSLRKILKSPLLPFLYRYLNFSPQFLLPRSFGSKKLSRQQRIQYTHPFSTPAERWGTLRFAQSLLTDQDWFGQLWQQMDLLSAKPALLIWGLKDQMIGASYLLRFQQKLPLAQTLRLENCGHFPLEEEPEIIAETMRNWLRE